RPEVSIERIGLVWRLIVVLKMIPGNEVWVHRIISESREKKMAKAMPEVDALLFGVSTLVTAEVLRPFLETVARARFYRVVFRAEGYHCESALTDFSGTEAADLANLLNTS